MDYLAQGSSQPIVTDLEKRKSPRKPLRQRITIGTVEHGILQGQTLDISVGGLSVMSPISMATRTLCVVRFELLVDGRLVRFFGNGKVANCCCAGMDGFRIGMQFQVDDPKLLPSLNRFLAM
jgi:hypothetical protein